MSATFVSDRVHGFIQLQPCSWKIVHTPEYQRLSMIKQLGAASFVFPSASTTRMEHCIGVAHLARKMGTHFQITQPELGITNEELLCLELAGLCHDLGHGPYSHAYESFCESEGIHFHHEKMSVDILNLIVTKHKLTPILLSVGISDDELHTIAEMIFGSREEAPHGWEWVGPPPGKEFLYEIVSNKRTGLDVDRFDYYVRDSDRASVKICFDCDRLINMSKVCKVGDQNIICYSVKAKQCIVDAYETRYRLHKCIYSHKTIKAVELWIFDIFKKASGWFEKMFGITFENAWTNVELFATLDDSVFSSIIVSLNDEHTSSKGNKDEGMLARAIHDLHKRRIWKIRRQFYFDNEGEATLQMQKWQREFDGDKRYLVNMTTIHYGNKDKDPMENVIFYSDKDRFTNKFVRICPPYQLWIVRLFGLPSTLVM